MIYTDFLDDDELNTYVQWINSRAKSLHKTGCITVEILRDRIYASGGKCDWCTVSIVRQPFEVDHIISLGNGGGNDTDNLAVSCPDCNRAKASKHAARFALETYARTNNMTVLLQRVLDFYHIEATTQKSLFASDEDKPTIEPVDDISDDPPPYIWGEG